MELTKTYTNAGYKEISLVDNNKNVSIHFSIQDGNIDMCVLYEDYQYDGEIGKNQAKQLLKFFNKALKEKQNENKSI